MHPIHEGLTPNGEVLPQKLVEVVNLAKKLGLKMIYSEDLIDPRSAQAIAEQIPGAKVEVLSPIEGVNATEQKAGVRYLDKMYQDLADLKGGSMQDVCGRHLSRICPTLTESLPHLFLPRYLRIFHLVLMKETC